MQMAWDCHIDVDQGIIRVGTKKASKGLEIFSAYEENGGGYEFEDSLGILQTGRCEAYEVFIY